MNATVNHELRNPLNSIKSNNTEKKMLYQKLNQLLDQTSVDKCLMKQILVKLENNLKI